MREPGAMKSSASIEPLTSTVMAIAMASTLRELRASEVRGRAAGADPAFPQTSIAELKAFLESADLVKFAGLEATPEMADGATGKARNYLTVDSGRKEEVK